MKAAPKAAAQACGPRSPARLFLYGSLLTGSGDRRLDRRLELPLRRGRPAQLAARLYDLGPYPGAVPAVTAAERIYGLVVTITDPRLLRDIDRYEDYSPGDAGSEFVRTTVRARLLISGKVSDCWVYFYNRGIAGRPRIIGGDYLHYAAARRTNG